MLGIYYGHAVNPDKTVESLLISDPFAFMWWLFWEADILLDNYSFLDALTGTDGGLRKC